MAFGNSLCLACLLIAAACWQGLHAQSPSQVGEWQVLPKAQVVAIHMIKVPASEYWLLLERRSLRQQPAQFQNFIAGLYSETTGQYHIVTATNMLFCSGHTITEDGDIVILGGHDDSTITPPYDSGIRAVRIFRRDQLADLNNMTVETVSLDGMQPRWYPTATLTGSGKIYVHGGTRENNKRATANSFNEVIDPSNLAAVPQSLGPMPRAYMRAAGALWYPMNYLLPTGDIASFVGRFGQIIDPESNTVFKEPAAPIMPGYGDVQYPLTGTGVMLPLLPENGYATEFAFFGGQNTIAFANRTSQETVPGSAEIRRIRLTHNEVSGQYSWGTYEYDAPMRQPRVMADAVLLPNGKVLILNGVEIGVAGDALKAHYPVFAPELYDPVTHTTTQLSNSLIPRMYHSTAGLTVDGNVLVGGNDRSDRYRIYPDQPVSRSPTGPAEYRMELFKTPFFFQDESKPAFVDASDIVTGYDTTIQVEYTSTLIDHPVNVTAVRLVAPTSVTHSFNMHQRLVGLEILSDVNGLLTVRIPGNINLLPPGWYMMYLLNGDVYSRAVWVKLQRPASTP